MSKVFITAFIVLTIWMINTFAQVPGLTISGNPQSAMGATWTYRDSVNGTRYDLQGILFVVATNLCHAAEVYLLKNLKQNLLY